MRPSDGLFIQCEKPNFAFIDPAYWIREPQRTLISCNARLSTNRSMPNILAQLSSEKQWVGGGGVYYTCQGSVITNVMGDLTLFNLTPKNKVSGEIKCTQSSKPNETLLDLRTGYTFSEKKRHEPEIFRDYPRSPSL